MIPQPTLAHVPGILLRTILRLFARILFGIAGIFLLVGVAIGYFSILVCTWKSPRTPLVQATSDFLVASYRLAVELKSTPKR